MITKTILSLKEKIVTMALHFEKMLTLCLEGLEEHDGQKLEEVITVLEDQIDQYDIEIDNYCVNSMARYQPEAKDLRTILTIMKLNNDLERMGDLSVNIAKSSKVILKRKVNQEIMTNLLEMGQDTVKMVHTGITALINEDLKGTEQIEKRENIVDEIGKKILAEAKTEMSQHAEQIDTLMNILRISKNLERISDLTLKLLEEIVFMIEGKIIRHRA
ncbi:MAG: phosphate signaling complex protein PhoU [Spirochaetes bacterium]|nr:phosphate signaling complex protein PhoU [Spirochaetota bacterium]